MTVTDQPSTAAVRVRRPRKGITIAAVLALVLMVIAVGVVAVARLRPPGDASPEAGFARDMSSHHGQAVEMAMLAVQQADSKDIRTLALDMGLTQQAQIGMMRAWLRSWNLSPTSTEPPMAWMGAGQGMSHEKMGDSNTGNSGQSLMPGLASAEEMKTLRASRGPGFDSYFIDLVVRHHVGGIQMVDAVLALDPDDQVYELATSMKNGQKSEIEALNRIKDALPSK